MRVEALFGLSVLLSFVAYVVIAKMYVWPRLLGMRREDAFTPLVVPHTFRFIGLSFLVPGVVSPSLPAGFAIPAAYGDLGAAMLALAALWALRTGAVLAIPILWLLNLWGAIDLLNAIYQGQVRLHIGLGSLGAAYYIPTMIVPGLLVTHAMMFLMLLRPRRVGP